MKARAVAVRLTITPALPWRNGCVLARDHTDLDAAALQRCRRAAGSGAETSRRRALGLPRSISPFSIASRASRDAATSRGSRSLLQTIWTRSIPVELLVDQLEDRGAEIAGDATYSSACALQPVLQENVAELSARERQATKQGRCSGQPLLTGYGQLRRSLRKQSRQDPGGFASCGQRSAPFSRRCSSPSRYESSRRR